MTKPDLKAVPEWVVIMDDGRVVRQGDDGLTMPTSLLKEGAKILGVTIGGLRVAVACSDLARCGWVTTVDVKATGDDIRYTAPSLEMIHPIHPVRLWVPPAGNPVVLTDGPLERAIEAIQKLEAAWPQ